MQCARQDSRSTRCTVVVAVTIAVTVFVSAFAGRTASASTREQLTRSSISPAVAATFPLGIAGLAQNSDGSRTLWVMNVQPSRLIVGGTSIFAIVDVVFRAQPGYKLGVRSGSNCSLTSSEGADVVECLPAIEASQLTPLLTFTSNRPYPAAATQTVELNSSSAVTQALNVALPRSARTAASVRAYLTKQFDSHPVTSTIVYVEAGKPSEYGYTLSKTSIPLGWVTFVVTNRGRLDHSFSVCPDSGQTTTGLLDNCLQTSGGASYATTVDDTLPLKPGETGFFTMRFTSRGKYEYLSDVTGQPSKGAKGQLTVQ
jgi:uncharacterized cupredoxin-like copper-binding protein